MLRPYAGVCRYKSFADTMGGPPADTERLWAERAEHYRSRRPRSGKALPVWGPPDNDKGVPRCMAVAQCSGCGRKSFWRGDGTRLSPCEHGCGHSFYCSDVCAKVRRGGHSCLSRLLPGTLLTATS